MTIPPWVYALLILPVAVLLLLVGVGINWWIAVFIFGPILVADLHALVFRRRRLGNRDERLS